MSPPVTEEARYMRQVRTNGKKTPPSPSYGCNSRSFRSTTIATSGKKSVDKHVGAQVFSFFFCVANLTQTEVVPSFSGDKVWSYLQSHCRHQKYPRWKVVQSILGYTLFVSQLGAALRHGNQYHLSPCGVSSIQAIPSLRRSSKACWALSSVHCVARMSA